VLHDIYPFMKTVHYRVCCRVKGVSTDVAMSTILCSNYRTKLGNYVLSFTIQFLVQLTY